MNDQPKNVGQPQSTDDPSMSFSYLSERDQALDHDRCFLCGEDLTQVKRTDEHVFPQWMLRDFALYTERLTLPNGTTIPYRQLRIPCCDDCNTVWLSQLEDDVATAVRAGAHDVEAFNPARLAIWMAKIFYGLVFKDLSLAADRLHPTGDKLVDDETLKRFAELHHVLQVARRQVDLALGQTPASVFVLRTLDATDPRLRFDYRDLIAPPFLALRLGGVGLVACLLDWGAVANASVAQLEVASQLVLHPTQFSEVAALCAHWHIRMNRTPKYISIAGEGARPDQLITLPLGGMSSKPIFDEFDPELYAHLLALFTGFPIERLWYADRGELWTSLEADRKPLQLPDVDTHQVEPPMPPNGDTETPPTT